MTHYTAWLICRRSTDERGNQWMEAQTFFASRSEIEFTDVSGQSPDAVQHVGALVAYINAPDSDTLNTILTDARVLPLAYEIRSDSGAVLSTDRTRQVVQQDIDRAAAWLAENAPALMPILAFVEVGATKDNVRAGLVVTGAYQGTT